MYDFIYSIYGFKLIFYTAHINKKNLYSTYQIITRIVSSYVSEFKLILDAAHKRKSLCNTRLNSINLSNINIRKFQYVSKL